MGVSNCDGFAWCDQALVPDFACRDPSEIPWDAVGAEYVAEATGVYLTAEKVR
jgi:glyceraldehyde-3-phosphate dehydrogenase/erythrose-4-phosphate dehydrogenase